MHFSDASVRNNTTNSHIGIVAGYVGLSNCRFKGVVENVWVEGCVNNNSTSSYAGGICGFLAYGKVSNCIANVDVVSATINDLGTGGICGYQYDGENLKAYLKQKYDTATYFNTLLSATDYALKCDSFDVMPDQKGRVKPRYRNKTREILLKYRSNIYNGGRFYLRKNPELFIGLIKTQVALFVWQRMIPPITF